MAPDGADTNPTRRRVVRGGVALGVALLGAGFLRPYASFDEGVPASDPAPPTPTGPRRSLSISVADGPTTVPPTPTPTGGRDPNTSVRSSGSRTPTDPTVSTPEPTDDDGNEESSGESGGGGGGAGGGGGGGAGDGGGGGAGDGGGGGASDVETPTTPTAGETDLVVDAPPVRFTDLVPGSSGRTTVTASLAGDSADLWLAAAGVDGGENGLAEPERVAGDDDAAGELLAALRVTLTAGGTTLYEGPLAGLDVAGVRVAGCATGDVSLVLDWALPETAGNEVQTDGARVTLRLGATDCGASNPFAG